MVIIDSLTVYDAFGRSYSTAELDDEGTPRWEGLQPPQDWTLFQVDGVTPDSPGLPTAALLLWHVAELPLESLPFERVQFGLDEESNLLWAVERIVDGREVESREIKLVDDNLHPKFNSGKPSGDARLAREYAYVPGEGVASYWHPYEITEIGGRRWLQRRKLTDLSRQRPVAMPDPQAEVLQPDEVDSLHKISPLAVPSNGIEVERRWQLARDMKGRPILWIQRQHRSLTSPPGRLLRFDVMRELLDQ